MVRIAAWLLTLIAGWSVAEPARVLVVVGPSDHPPGTHEVAAGGRLAAHCLANSPNVEGVEVDLSDGWPEDAELRAQADTVFFIGDRFPPSEVPSSRRALLELGEMMDRGCGIVCVHYATGLSADAVEPSGEHPLLYWMGGYFATRCEHHQSIARIFPEATISPAAAAHPISRGWREFTIHDEPYINNYFGPDGNRPMRGVTVLATSMLPPEDPRPEAVAWCIERPDSGRGVGIVMPHYYRNWANDDLRRFVLNAVLWSAKRDVPAGGVESGPIDLTDFDPGSIEPQRRRRTR